MYIEYCVCYRFGMAFLYGQLLVQIVAALPEPDGSEFRSEVIGAPYSSRSPSYLMKGIIVINIRFVNLQLRNESALWCEQPY